MDKTMAEALSELFQTPITSSERSQEFVVGETPTHHIVVLTNLIFNFRISRRPKDHPMSYDRSWCYYGKDLPNFLRTIEAAVNWDGADDTEPEGWDKNAKTGEYANPDKIQEAQ
jgi:hypothetical protein